MRSIVKRNFIKDIQKHGQMQRYSNALIYLLGIYKFDWVSLELYYGLLVGLAIGLWEDLNRFKSFIVVFSGLC